MKSVYQNFLIKLFNHKKVFLAEDIIEKLIDEFSVKRDHARRILKEATSTEVLYSSKPLRFSHGQFAYSPINNKSVFYELLKMKSGLNEVYKLLCLTCLPENEMLKFAQSIYTTSKPKEALDKLVSNLNSLEPVSVKEYGGCRIYYLTKQGDKIVTDLKCEEIIQNLKKDAKICQLIYSYFLNLNLISSGKYRDTNAPYILVGDEVSFDVIGYSTLAKNRSNKKTTFLFDVLISYQPGQAIKRFFKRAKAFYHRQNNGKNHYSARVINVIVLNDIEPALRNMFDPYKNYMWISLRQLFGKYIDSFMWLIGQNAKAINRKILDQTFYSELSKLAESDFSHLFSQFLDDYFEIVVNSCLSRLINKSFLGKTVYDLSGCGKEFDGYFEDDKSIWIIEAKNLGKSMVKWESYNSKGILENDCLKYFFEDKVSFLRKISPNKKIYACYVSKSGYSQRDNSESVIQNIDKFPGFNTFLLTPREIVDMRKKNDSGKEFHWLNKLYISDYDLEK